MSGSGGFYKYRCKYFYTHNCTNWVYVNNAPCANCLAEGRDAEDAPAAQSHPSWRVSRDIFVPLVQDGTLHYTLMEIVTTGSSESGGNYWTLRHKATQQPRIQIPTTGDTPRAVFSMTGVGQTAPAPS